MKYSVIIPVYNGEKTVARCLNSLLKQNYNSAEILLINDGSTDNTDEICKNYMKKYSAVRYFAKENGGVSSARNIGLNHASGRYILFVDCDDYVSEQYFRIVDQALSNAPVDMLVFSWVSVCGDSSNTAVLSDQFLQGPGEVAKWAERAMQTGQFGSLWSKAFRTDFIQANNLRFNESLKIAEDWSFIFRYILLTESVQILSAPLYMVSLDNNESLSRKARTYLCEQLFEANQNMLKALNIHADPASVKPFASALAYSYFRSPYTAAKELRKFSLSASERRKEIRAICKQYARGGVYPSGLKSLVLAIPIYTRLAWAIDYLTSRK